METFLTVSSGHHQAGLRAQLHQYSVTSQNSPVLNSSPRPCRYPTNLLAGFLNIFTSFWATFFFLYCLRDRKTRVEIDHAAIYFQLSIPTFLLTPSRWLATWLQLSFSRQSDMMSNGFLIPFSKAQPPSVSLMCTSPTASVCSHTVLPLSTPQLQLRTQITESLSCRKPSLYLSKYNHIKIMLDHIL